MKFSALGWKCRQTIDELEGGNKGNRAVLEMTSPQLSIDDKGWVLSG